MKANGIRNRSLFKYRLSILEDISLQITEERKKQVIDLYFNQHKSYAEIAQIMKMSPRDIHAIIKEEEARRQKYEHKQHQEEMSSKAYELFTKAKRPVEVAIALNLREPAAAKYYREYWRLKRLHTLNLIYKATNGNLQPFLKLYNRLMKGKGLCIEQVVNAVDIAIHKLPHMESLYIQAKDQAEKMQHTVQRLANDIMALERKISILDKIALSSEQECKRTEQRVQQLGDKKARLEKLIANILNGGGYSKLEQIAKENVKAVLAENKQVISVSFAALIQTLKADPEMIKIIYNIPTGNDAEQHKDNNNNITKYLEFNKDSILDLAEKSYENIIEVFTNNAIDNAFSNPILSSPSSSLTFSNPFNQSDTHRIEESEIYHNSEGDIAD
jgi:predicted DNA-binding protein YlxM (UPF0122 family)